MANGEGASSSGGNRWPVRISGAVGAAIGIALGMWLGPLIGAHGTWGLITVMVATAIGIVIGNLIGLRIFHRPPAGGPSA